MVMLLLLLLLLGVAAIVIVVAPAVANLWAFGLLLLLQLMVKLGATTPVSLLE